MKVEFAKSMEASLMQQPVKKNGIAFFEEKAQKNIPPMSRNLIAFLSCRVWDVTCIVETVCDAKILLFFGLLNFFRIFIP